MKSNGEVYQDDVADLLRALGLSDHARPYSAHEVLQREILPRIRELYAGLEVAVRAGNALGLKADAARAVLSELRTKVDAINVGSAGLAIDRVLALIDDACEAQQTTPEEKR